VTFTETLVFYLVIGLAVAAAQWSAGRIAKPAARNLSAIAAVPFWPLFLPLLLSGDQPAPSSVGAAAPPDELARSIRQVETELREGLASLSGGRMVPALLPNRRLEELHDVLTAQADRIRRMDEVLGRSGPDELLPGELQPDELAGVGVQPDSASAMSESDVARDRASRAARRANLRQLAELRRTAEAELRTNLDRIRELVSQLHLVEFSGPAPGRAEELLAEIAAVIESMALSR
jgi:hypothetical protein